MRILITNDDGVAAPGLVALYKAARDLGEVHVIAPSKVRSACGHAVTFHRPLEAWPEPMADADGAELCTATALYGMPADCVKVALTKLLPEPVDLVLSGINAGCNVGVHTVYSGTVAAAREAVLAGVAGISMSLHLGRRDVIPFERASEIAGRVLRQILAEPLAPGTFLNVNIPILDDGAEPEELRVVPVSRVPMVDEYTGEPDESGKVELTVGRHVRFHEVPEGSDIDLLFKRHVTVSPMTVATTDVDSMDEWRGRLGD